MDTLIIPKENIEIYNYLYNIETCLRELIIDSLESISGKRWFKERLPDDVLSKYKNGINYKETICGHPPK